MKTTLETTEGKALVTLEGVLDSYIAEKIAEQFEPLYELNDTEITLDCTNLEYIASSGLRLFLMLLQSTKPNGCSVIVKGASEELMSVFKDTGFDALFKFI